jgi:hypothetical protein
MLLTSILPVPQLNSLGSTGSPSVQASTPVQASSLALSQVSSGASAANPAASSDTLVVTTQPPSTVTAGSPFGLVVSAETSGGSVDTSFSGSVAVANWFDGYFGGPLGGMTGVSAVNGVATFSSLTLTQATSCYTMLEVAATGLPMVYTSSFTVTAAAATQLAVPWTPSGVLANGPFSLTVYAEDQFGNVDSTFNGNVTLALASNPGSATLGGTLTVQAENGDAYFSDLTIDKTGSGYTLQATSDGLTAATTAAFNVTDQLVVTTAPPGTVTTGTPFGLVVAAEDGKGNVDTSFNGNVTVANPFGFGNWDGGPLGGTLTVSAVNGVATFSDLTLDRVTSWADLEATASGLQTVYTSSFTVIAAPATQLVVASSPGGVLANGSFNLTVDAEDQFGNIDSTFNGNVTLALASNPSNATLGGTLTVQAEGGVASFSDLTIDKTGSGYTLEATSAGLTAGITAAFNVTDQLVVATAPPNTVAAGTPFGLVVAAEDGKGSVDTSFSGSVTVADAYNYSELGGTLTVNAVNGMASFSDLTEYMIGTHYLYATSSGLSTVCTSYFTVAAAPATQLVVLPWVYSGVLANGPFSLNVDAEDQFGNIDSTFNGNVTLALANNPSSATLGGTLTVQAGYGMVMFSGLTIDKMGSGYTLEATSAGLTTAITRAFDVTEQLVVTTAPPSTVTAGTPFGLVVAAEDGQRNVDTSFSGSVTVANPWWCGGALGGTTTLSAVNGVATFSDLTLDQATSWAELQVTASGLPTAYIGRLTVTAAPATQLVVPWTPSGILANGPFNLTVDAEDQYGNIDPTFDKSVTLALATNPNNATLGGTLTVQAVNGVASFSGPTISKPGSGYTLQASSGSLTAGTTAAFDVTDQLVVTTAPPSTVTAGTPFGLVVTAEDGQGNVDTSFSGSMTVSNYYYWNGGTLGGTNTVNAVNGVATFSGLTLTQATHISYSAYAELQVTASGLPMVYTNYLTVTAAPATQLVVPWAPSGVLTNGSFNLTVDAEDQYGNIDSTFNGNVTLALASNPSNATLHGTLTVQAESGVASFSDLTIDKTGSGYTLQATSAGLTAGTTAAFNVTDQLVVTTAPPSTVTAGTPFSLVVAAEDGQGNVDTSFNGSVTVANYYWWNGGALGGTTTVSAVNGVATFSDLTLKQVTSYAELQVTASGLPTVYTSNFNVMAAPATQLVLASSPSGVLTNGSFNLTVDAEDQFGNVDSTFNGNVTLALANNPGNATLGGTLTVQAEGGVAGFSDLTIDKTGSGYTLQATRAGLTAGITAAFDVTDQLVVTTAPPSTVTAGTPFSLVVAAEDGQGNVDTSFRGSVTVTDYYQTLDGTTTVSAVNGVATFSGLTLDNASSYNFLYVTASGLPTVYTSSFTVTAAPATQLVVLNTPSGVLANGLFSLTIYAFDPYCNYDLTFNGDVTLTLAANPGNATLGGTLTVQAENGVASFSDLTIDKTGSGYRLQAASTGLTAGTTAAFSVTDQLVVTAQPPSTVTAGTPFVLVVTAEDGQGNLDTSFSGSVTLCNPNGTLGSTLGVNVTLALASNPDNATLGGTLTVQAANGVVSVSAVNGVATFSGLTLTQATTYAELQATASGLASTTTSYFTVRAAPAQLVVPWAPSGALANGPFDLMVDAEDQYGNIDSAFNGNVTLALASNPGSATLGGTLTVQAESGVATFSDLTIDKTGSGYTLQATSAGLTAGTTAAFNVTDQLVVTTAPPSTVTAGTPFVLVVTAEDGQGNVDTSFSGSVTVCNPTANLFYGYSGLLGGTLTVSAVNGVATFSDLTLTQVTHSWWAAYAHLEVTASGLTPVYTNSFTVTGAPATQLVASAPSGVLAKGPFDLAVYAEDRFGDIDSAFNGNVTLALATNSGTATLGGTLTVQAVNGEAYFSNLTIDKTGSGYTLQAATTGLTAAITAAFNVTDQLVITTAPPSTVTAGTPFGLVVMAEDGQGKVDTSFSGSVTVCNPNPNDSGYGGSLGGTLTISAVNGVATFSSLTLKQATYYAELEATASGLTPLYTSCFIVTAARATQLVVASAPSSVLANGPFGLTVYAEDQYGNVDSTFNGNVTLALASNPGNATLGGTRTVQAEGGVASFSDLTIDKTGSGYTLQAAGTGLTARITAAFNVTDQLVVTTAPPSTVIAGTSFGLVVTAEDGKGNVDTSFSGSVTVCNIRGTNSSDGGPLHGSLTVSAVNGVATFSGLTLDYVGSGAGLIATSGDLLLASTGYFTVTAAPATQLVVASAPSGVLANGPFGLTVYAEDQYGNINSTFNGNVAMALATNPRSATLGGTLTVQAENGVASFSGLTIDKTGNGYTLQAASTGLSAGITAAFNVTDQLVVTTAPPSTVTAGTPFGLVVTAEDGQGNVDTSFSGSVTVTDAYGYPLGGTRTVNAVNGVASFLGLTLKQATACAELDVTASGMVTVYTSYFTVTAAPATQLVASAPSGVLANGPFGLTVYAEDQYGNIASTFNFSGLTINKTGNGYTLQAASTGLTTGTTAAFNVTDQLVVTTQPLGSVTAGTPFGLVVKAEDGQGNVDTSFNGSVTVCNHNTNNLFGSGGPLGGTLTVSAVNGVATFSDLTLTQATYRSQFFTTYAELKVTASGLPSGYTNSFTVTAAPATQLVVSGPSGVVVNGPFGLTVYAEDQYGNIDSTFSRNVTLALATNPGSATLGGTTIVSVVNGAASFSGLTINKLGSGYTLQAASTGLTTGTTAAFNVTDQLVVTTAPPSTVTAGTSFGLVVTVEDGKGNVDTSFSGSVTVCNPNANNGGYGGPLGGTLTVSAVNGVATFSGLTLRQATAYAELQVTASGLPTVYTSSFTVTAASATHLVVSTPSGVVTTGPFGLTIYAEDQYGLSVYAEDQYGNIDSTFNGNVTLALATNANAATLGGMLTMEAVNGVASFSGLTIDKTGSNYTLQAASTGLTTAITAAFNVSDQLVVTTQPPSAVTAGTPFGLVVTVEDGQGNVASSFNGGVTVSYLDLRLDAEAGRGGGGTLGDTLTVGAVNGVATFSDLTLKQASYAELEVIAMTASGLMSTAADSFTVTSAAATQLSVSAPSAAVLTSTPFGLTVYAEDSYGNTDPTFNGSVTLALAANPGSATLRGTLTVQAVNGVVTFSDLTIDKPGAGYTLQATNSGLTAGTSLPFNVTNDQLVVTSGPPSSVTAGTGFGFTVSAEDGSGNVDTAFNGSVTVSNYDGSGVLMGGGALGGTLTVNAVNGVATFSGLTLKQPTTNFIPFSGLVVASAPSVVLANGPFCLTVYAVNSFGNINSTFNGSVTLALATNPGSAMLGGTLTVQAECGIASFSGLTINKIGSGYTLQAATTGLTAVFTAAFNVTNQLVVTTAPPSTVTVGTPVGLALTAEDGQGNADASFTTLNQITSSFYFSADLSVTASGVAPTTTSYFTVTSAAATQLMVVSPSSGVPLVAAWAPSGVVNNSPFTLTVDAEDPYGNIASTFNGNVTLALAANPCNATLGGTLTVQAFDGVATFSGLTINKTGSGYTLQATSSGLTSATTSDFAVTNQLVVTTAPPSTVTAGSPFGLAITIEDGQGNVDTSFNGSVTVSTLSGNGGGALGGTPTVSAVNGVATFSGLTLTQVTSSAELQVSASGLPTAFTGCLTVTAASATQLSVSAPSAAVLTSAPFSLIVDAEDSYGNMDPTFDGSVTLALATNPGSATLGGMLTVQAVNGIATFSGLTMDKPGTGYTLQATNSGLTTGTSLPFNVTSDQLVVTSERVTSRPVPVSVSRCQPRTVSGTWTPLSTAA